MVGNIWSWNSKIATHGNENLEPSYMGIHLWTQVEYIMYSSFCLWCIHVLFPQIFSTRIPWPWHSRKWDLISHCWTSQNLLKTSFSLIRFHACWLNSFMISKSSRNTIVECIIIGLIDILFSTYNMLLVHEWCDSSFPQASGPTFVTSMWETINPKTPFFFFC